MAKRRRRSRPAERDSTLIVPTTTSRVVRLPYDNTRLLLSPYSDLRFFHPDNVFAPVYSTRKDSRDVVDVNVNNGRKLGSGKYRSLFGFAVPGKVSVCVRRKQRREVLFALRRTGRGAYSRKRRNYWSDVRC